MATRTTGAIALRPTGNAHGGYYFLSLTTGRRLNRNSWTALPMPAEVIERVHTLARRSGASRGLTFADRSGDPFLDPDYNDSDDESYDPDNEVSDSDSDDDDENPTDLPNAADAIDIPIEGVDDDEARQELNENIEPMEDTINEENGDEAVTNEDDGSGDEAATNEDDESGNEAATNDDDGNEADYANEANTEDAMNEKYGERSGAHDLRTRRP